MGGLPMINYEAKTKEAKLLIDQGLYSQAMFTLSNILENLYSDFYQQFLAACTPPERRLITEAEEKFTRKSDKSAREQGFPGLTLGGKIRFFSEEDVVIKAQGILNAEFLHFRSFDPRLFNALRIETVHKDLVVTD